ncbi:MULTISPECIES: DMT family transporter [Ramlibacter]|uniref:EamA family transporter n=1 Tax=Ramlibacter pinisoli TaxID=2682844 RepID=A0A6N8IQ44_9BURK|nr:MULTISPECIES: DMT family transporter [Ramlibacter]MBA2964035.1 DMT family transporter [Ramlibacter sp. CGMCC 1.13660]MVQ29001.1 EamA family transporter [Ramlibacter pinisoli]
MTHKALPLVLVLTLVWGTNWALFPFAVQEVSVWTFRSVSMVLAAAGLLAFARLRGQSLRIPRAKWPALAAASVLYFVVWNVASTYSALLIPSGQAAILGFTMPVWTVLIAWLLLGDRPSPRMWLAVVLAALAVLLLAIPAREAYRDAPAGFVLGVAAGLGWAAGTVVLKRAAVSAPALVLTAWQLLVAAVPIGLVALWVGHGQWFVPSWTSVLVIGYITLVPLAIGNAAWFAVVGLLPATVAGLSAVLVPIVAMVTGAIVHAEPLGPFQLGAMLCSGSALFLALAKAKPRPAQDVPARNKAP